METEKNHDKMPSEKLKTDNNQDDKIPAKKVKRQATQEQLDDPFHGVKLVDILESLVDYYGWKYLSDEVNILCFKHNPTMKVSLKFLRKMKWAREHVEDLYLRMLDEEADLKGQKKLRDAP